MSVEIKKYTYVLTTLIALLACETESDPTPDPSFVYFLVGEIDPVRNESYILALKDPDDIAEAREIIASSDDEKLVLAKITKSKSDNFYLNKDLTTGEKWSWHISSFEGFVDFTIEIYDGWPSYVEENYEEWVDNTKGSNGKGIIGFWNYTLKREVDKSELY